MNGMKSTSAIQVLPTNVLCGTPRNHTAVSRSQSEGSLFLQKRRMSQEFNVMQEPDMKVIVDVDAGVDDAMALLLLLAADTQKIIKILGITCTHGNTSVKNVCVNVLRILGTMGRFDIPVYKGVEEPLIPCDSKCPEELEHFHGLDGFGDLTFAYTPNMNLLQTENAITALHHITSDPHYAGKVSLVCLAPLTNIAIAMKTYSNFSQNLKDIYIMGGNSSGIGNITSAGEFNFYTDPEAAHIVLNGAQCPVHLLPWETCLHTEISFDWRFNVLGAVQSTVIELLNEVEKKVWGKAHYSTWFPCDPLLAAIVLEPKIVTKSRKCHVTVELHGTHTRGQVVLDHLQIKDPNVTLIEQVDIFSLKKLLLWAAGHPEAEFHTNK